MSDGGKIRIVLSGPESSGKSTIAAALAEHFNVPTAPEYARVHLEAGKPYPETPGDLTELAKHHLAWQRQHVADDAACGIYDTDMLNYFIWADVAFGFVPEEIDQWFAAETHHIHLLCMPDLGWQTDPLREFPELAKRQTLFDRHVRELEQRGIHYFVICGEGNARSAMAESAFQVASAPNTLATPLKKPSLRSSESEA